MNYSFLLHTFTQTREEWQTTGTSNLHTNLQVN